MKLAIIVLIAYAQLSLSWIFGKSEKKETNSKEYGVDVTVTTINKCYAPNCTLSNIFYFSSRFIITLVKKVTLNNDTKN